MNLSKTDYYREQRRELIVNLRMKGIYDTAVLEAMGEVPREKFINPGLISRAYDDTALPIECEQTISQPYTVAYMTSLLKLTKGDKVLEIGTGSGYQACILYKMGAKVFTVERIQELYQKANRIFSEFGYNINTRFGDGSLGWKEFAPYSGIIVTAAAPSVPKTLIDQLCPGGRLVIPVGGKHSQTMHLIEKIDEKNIKEYQTDSFKFVPLIGKEAWEGE